LKYCTGKHQTGMPLEFATPIKEPAPDVRVWLQQSGKTQVRWSYSDSRQIECGGPGREAHG